MRLAPVVLPLALIVLAAPALAAPVKSFACSFRSADPERALPATLELSFDVGKATAAIVTSDGARLDYRSDPMRFYDFGVVDLGASLSGFGSGPGDAYESLIVADGELFWLKLTATTTESSIWTCTAA